MRKVWVQVLVCIILGGMIRESVHITTGRNFKSVGVIAAIIFFTLITIYFSISDRMKNSKAAKDRKIQDEELLDQ